MFANKKQNKAIRGVALMQRKTRASIALLLVVCMLLSISGLAFAAVSDIKGHWAEVEITYFLDKGHASGYEDGTFKPDNNITRAEFIKLVNKVFNFTGTANVPFSDVSSDEWFAQEIAHAVAQGYLEGYGDGRVGPNDSITRQEVSVILSRILKLDLKDMEELNKFKDSGEMPKWSKGHINAIAVNGMVDGYPDGYFKHEKNITRAEAVVLLYRALKFSGANLGLTAIKSLVGDNGKIEVLFDKNVSELTKDDFTVTSKLDGKSYELKSLSFDGSNNKFSFEAIESKYMSQTLAVTIAAAASSRKISGSAGCNIIIPITSGGGSSGGGGGGGGGGGITVAGIAAISDMPVTVSSSVYSTVYSLGLPQTVSITLSDGTTSTANVTWDGGTPAYNVNVPGVYTFSGTLSGFSGEITNPSNLKVYARVIVSALPNSAPGTPVITISPALDNYGINDEITITAASTDPDGDAMTYEWTGRLAETSKYPVGRQVITAVAVDEHGVKSIPATVVFYVTNNADGSGGLLLTDAESRIYENGIEGTSITKYKLNVPSVPGHSASEDFGWVKGLNKNTHQWDILQCGATYNGISFSNILTAGTYTKLEFYYFTPHNCMYNQSNITYTVSFAYDVTNPESEVLPVASAVIIAQNGSTLEGKYTYSDANGDLEGASIFKWYRADDVVGTNKSEIAGAAGKTYTLTSADTGKFLTFEVTPVALTGADGKITGTAVQSQASQTLANSVAAITGPTARDVTIKSRHLASAMNGKYYESFRIFYSIEGKYTYEDGSSNNEGASIYKWYRSDDAAGTNIAAITGETTRTYQLTSSDESKYIFFEVTPKDQAGTAAGTATLSKPVFIPEESPNIDSANLQVNASQPASGGGALTSKFQITVQKPTGERKTIAPLAQTSYGALEVGDKIKVTHTYSDNNNHPEGTPVFKWYRSTQSYVFGDMTKLVSISGATTDEYTVSQSDVGQYIGFILIPVAQISPNATIGGENWFEYFYSKVTGNIPVSSISAIPDINLTVSQAVYAKDIGLPQSVMAVLSDGTKPVLTVSWDNGTPAYDGSTPGTYIFSGTLTLPQGVTNPGNLNATVKVIVAEPTGTYTISQNNTFADGFSITLSNLPATSYFNVYRISNTSTVNPSNQPVTISTKLISFTGVFAPITDLEVWIYSDAQGTKKIAAFTLSGNAASGTLVLK